MHDDTPPHGIERPEGWLTWGELLDQRADERDRIDRRTALLMTTIPVLWVIGVVMERWVLPAFGL